MSFFSGDKPLYVAAGKASPPLPSSQWPPLNAAALFGCYALYLTHSQLSTFRARSVSKPAPSPSASDTGVDQTAEDALDLGTLETLARGINFDIRNAALKIITERAGSEKNIVFILHKVKSPSPSTRLQALRALRCFAYSGSVHNLCNRRTFEALVECLHNCLPTQSSPADKAAEKEALFLISRLMEHYFVGREMIVDAGFIEWLKKVEVAGYNNAVEAVYDPDRYDLVDTSLWQIISMIIEESPEGRRLMYAAGLNPREGDDQSRMFEHMDESRTNELFHDVLRMRHEESMSEEDSADETLDNPSGDETIDDSPETPDDLIGEGI